MFSGSTNPYCRFQPAIPRSTHSQQYRAVLTQYSQQYLAVTATARSSRVKHRHGGGDRREAGGGARWGGGDGDDDSEGGGGERDLSRRGSPQPLYPSAQRTPAQKQNRPGRSLRAGKGSRARMYSGPGRKVHWLVQHRHATPFFTGQVAHLCRSLNVRFAMRRIAPNAAL